MAINRITYRLKTTKKHILILMGQRGRSTEFSVKTSWDMDNLDKIDSRAVCGGRFFRPNRQKMIDLNNKEDGAIQMKNTRDFVKKNVIRRIDV